MYFFLFQLERESLDQDSHLFTAELNCIIINVLFHLFFLLSFSTYRTVYNELVLATFNSMFETYGNYYQSACGPLLIVTSCWFRKTFLLRLVWSDKFLPGMFGRRCCRSCTRSVGCKCSQGCCRICCWMTRSWKCNCHLLLRMKAHSMSQRIWNVLC